MALNDIDKKLYTQKKRSREDREFSDVYNVDQASCISGENKEGESAKKRTGVTEIVSYIENRKRAWIVGISAVGMVVLLLSIAIGVARYREGLFQDDRVRIEVQGPDSVSTNQRVQFSVTYENANKVDLAGAKIELTYPEAFVLEDKDGVERSGLTGAIIPLGAVKQGEKKTIDLYGSFSASQQKTFFIGAAILYSPEQISGSFRQTAQKGVNIEGSIASVELSSPIEAASGENIDLLVSYTNNSRKPLYGARIQMTYPDDFFFQDADREPSDGNGIWYLDVVGVGETQSFHVRGRLNGENNSIKTFRVSIGVVGENNVFSEISGARSETRVIGSPFVIEQTVESGDVVRAGENMKYVITYENRGDLGLRDAIITVKIEGDVLYEPRLRLKNGSYDANTRTITWRAADVPELAIVDPGEVGSVEFLVPTKTEIPVESDRDKNFVAATTATIDSKDIPDRVGAERVVAKNYKEVRLEADTTVYLSMRDMDTNEPLDNIDFEVGKEMRLGVRWRIHNVYNDLNDANAVISLPADVVWEGTDSEEGEDVVFNERAQQLVWDLGAVKNGTGTFLPERTVSFVIRVLPQEYQRSGWIRLLQNMRFVGQDTFTGTSIIEENNEISCVEGSSSQCRGQYIFE